MGFVQDDGPGIDFDDLYAVWEQIAKTEEDLLTAERYLNEARAICCKQALEMPGKKPTVYELTTIVTHLGNNPEQQQQLATLSTNLAVLTALRTRLKGKLDTMHKRIAIWQTKSANSRRALIE